VQDRITPKRQNNLLRFYTIGQRPSEMPPRVEDIERILLRSIVERRETCREAAETIAKLLDEEHAVGFREGYERAKQDTKQPPPPPPDRIIKEGVF
jgi:flagellar biosynthesis/type III secretory pathway protein FliH